MRTRTLLKNVLLFMAGCIAFRIYHSKYCCAGNADILRQGETTHIEGINKEGNEPTKKTPRDIAAMTNENKLPAQMNKETTDQIAAPIDDNQIVVPMKNKGTNQTGHDSIEAVDDYFRFPCLKELSLSGAQPCVRTICGEEACNNTVPCTAFPLLSANNRSICTHDPEKEFIAKSIKEAGGFEDSWVKHMISVLNANPEMMLVDIGCNVGVYTLTAAAMSRRVVCVDANYENIRLVLNTLTLGNLSENVTLVWNALSYERGVAKLNINGYSVRAAMLRPWTFNSIRHQMKVLVIRLDELQSLVKGKPVFMKMDIESYEWNALQGGREFLKNSDVRYIQIEFRTPSTKVEISNLLRSFGYNSYLDINRKFKVQNVTEFSGNDLYFIK